LEAYQERVLQEKSELDEKRSKLEVFVHGDVCKNLPIMERSDLWDQLRAMKEYSLVLGRRIDRFLA